jgi:predicted transposase YbfD/YdcC
MQTKHLKRVLKEKKNGRIEILIILIKSLQGKVLHDFALLDPNGISSAELDAKSILTAALKHWSAENNLHWQLDISINEDT